MSKSDVKREPSRTQARAASRARRLRGAVLALLAEESPQPLNADVLLGVLERLHYDVTSRELAAALSYLRSRGYVEFEELRSGAARPAAHGARGHHRQRRGRGRRHRRRPGSGPAVRRIRKGVSPPHKGKKIKYPVGRRGFKLERMPLQVQAATFRALGQGVTYVDISAKLNKQGFSITAGSIGRYWRKVWKKTHKRLQEAYLIKEHLKEALRGKRKSSNAAMAEELLYTMIVKKLDELEREPPMPMLKEAREQGKVAGAEEEAAPEETEKKASPVLQAREIRRRWRELYGLDEETETSNEEEGR